MNLTDKFLARVVADNDQDLATIEEWWGRATAEEKWHLWDTIQREYRDPAMEIMSRFAQLTFGELMVKHKGV